MLARSSADVCSGSWPCENSSALRTRRSISEKSYIMELSHQAQIQLDSVSENCFFYISPMYEFSHSQGQNVKTQSEHMRSTKLNTKSSRRPIYAVCSRNNKIPFAVRIRQNAELPAVVAVLHA